MNGWSDFQSLFLNVPHLILNTFYKPNKPNRIHRTNGINRTKIVDRVYLVLNEEHFLKKRLKIRPTIQEILDFKVDSIKSLKNFFHDFILLT